jgi:hypothetical protein
MSPALRNLCGFCAIPTPAGVPHCFDLDQQHLFSFMYNEINVKGSENN